MKMLNSLGQYGILWVWALFGPVAITTPLKALDVSGVQSCDRYMVPKEVIKGQAVGQETCRMIETGDFEFQGRNYRRMDIGVTGTIPGYTLKSDNLRDAIFFNAYPEFVFPSTRGELPVHHGIGRYEMAKGTAMAVLYPANRSEWNGKMFVTLHGGGRAFSRGTLKVWNKNLNPEDPLKDISKYERLMLEKGYAVAKTWRSTPFPRGGDITVTLDDGTVLRERNIMEHPPLITGFVKLAGNALEDRLGRKPSRVYWYGHSGGARIGRMVNYKAGMNVDKDGKRIIHGIIVDDSAAGLYLPVLMKDGTDILFTTEEERQRFVPMLEISHLLYVNESPADRPSVWEFEFTNFLANKRLNAKLLREKGLWGKFRYYEIAGISHSGGEYLPEGKDGDIEILDMSRLLDGFIDLLDNWVEMGIAPPPTKSDWRDLGDADKDRIIENASIQMPEVACPLGVYHIFPLSRGAGGQGTTGFVSFSGEGMEPEDGRGSASAGPGTQNVVRNYVDMNRNGYRDFVETVTDAWQRVGLLKIDETFNRERYVACVDKAVADLHAEKFITPQTVNFYRGQARTMSLPVQ